MKLFIMQFSSTSRHFISLRSKYSLNTLFSPGFIITMYRGKGGSSVKKTAQLNLVFTLKIHGTLRSHLPQVSKRQC
jgi:hypothetical protein